MRPNLIPRFVQVNVICVRCVDCRCNEACSSWPKHLVKALQEGEGVLQVFQNLNIDNRICLRNRWWQGNITEVSLIPIFNLIATQGIYRLAQGVWAQVKALAVEARHGEHVL